MTTELGQTATLEIRTPEGVVFALPLAGPVTRSLALMIDLLLVVMITWVVSVALVLWVLVSPEWALALQALAFFTVQTLYAMVFEWWWRGQTVGKRVMGLRVVDDRGLGLRPGQVVVRNLLRAVDSLPVCYLVGGVAVVLSRHCQRLGDLAAGTVVIRSQPVRSVRIEALLAGQFNSFRQFPLIEARLRQKASAEEAGLALSALLRRDEIEPERRLRVFRELASHYRELAPFPLEATDGLTDEQYLRNVVETLFRKRGN
jgi:uncharacterized RDD family membrane protein YckC